MRLLVTGANGQLGNDVIAELQKRGHQVMGTDLQYDQAGIALDITDADAVSQVITDYSPDTVIHCAAWTAVDAAEEPENHDAVWNINVEGTRNIAKCCAQIGCKMIYISTDYVFDGQGDVPWEPDDCNYAPLNYYGKTKLEGEKVVASLLEEFYIVRIAWVFGVNGSNFVDTMLKLGKTHDTLTVVNDQIGTPTYTYDLSRLLVDMAETEKYGYYHVTNEGDYISWYDYAVEIFELAGYNTEVLPVTTEEYGQSKALRPHNSRLNRGKIVEKGFEPLPDWRDALARYLKEISS